LNTTVAVNALNQVLLLCLEAIVTSVALLGLFRLRSKFGMAPFYMALGGLQQLQMLLALSVYLEVVPGIVISPGSTILFTGTLFTILLVYIREDAGEARKLIVGLLAANLMIAALSFLLGLHLHSKALISTFTLGPEIFFQGFRVLIVGTLALTIDVFLIVLLYEAVAKLIPGSLFLSIYISMFIVLIFDTLAFVTGSFFEYGNYRHILSSAIVGKASAGALYSAILTAYLRKFTSETVVERDEIGMRDLFSVLTYRQRYEAIRSQATRDPLTGVYNRGFFEDCLGRELERSRRLGWPTSLLMIDVDDLKLVNDRFGHQVGDQILIHAGRALKETLRSSDFPCRYGGDEFVAVLPNTDRDSALRLAQHFHSELLRRCGADSTENSKPVASTTIGVASAPQDATEASALILAADRRLYMGKKHGRNRIVFEEA
jgi:diguanylate cyclase (GGDEF)-like protein